MKALTLVLLVASCWMNNDLPATQAPAAAAAEPAPKSGDAKFVQKNEHGGVLELVGDRAAALAAANRLMTAHCGEGEFTVVAEGEEAVATMPGGRQATAWRLHYQCG